MIGAAANSMSLCKGKRRLQGAAPRASIGTPAENSRRSSGMVSGTIHNTRPEATMGDPGIDVFVRWLLRRGVTSGRACPYFTVATLVCDHETLSRLRDQVPAGLLDESLAEEFLSLADPRETVEMLSLRIGRDISPDLFRKAFDRVVAASSDIDVLSGLMFVAGLYLDRHPSAFSLPRNLAHLLLRSADVDHRLAGLKALRHSTSSSGEIIVLLTAALKSDDCQERDAGLSQLQQLLETDERPRVEAADQETLDELRDVLAEVVDTALDVNTRRAAARCAALLGKGGTEHHQRRVRNGDAASVDTE
jgi:hypothetical protein